MVKMRRYVLKLGALWSLSALLILALTSWADAAETKPAASIPAAMASGILTALPDWDSKIIAQTNSIYAVCKNPSCTPDTLVSLRIHLVCKRQAPEQLKAAWGVQMDNLVKKRKPTPKAGDYQSSMSGDVLQGWGQFYQPESEGKIASSRDYWTQGFVSSPFMSITISSQAKTAAASSSGFEQFAQMAQAMIHNISSSSDMASIKDCMFGKFPNWQRTPANANSDSILMICNNKPCGEGSIMAYQLIAVSAEMDSQSLIRSSAENYKTMASQKAVPFAADMEEGMNYILQNPDKLKSTTPKGTELSMITLPPKEKFSAEMGVIRLGNFAFVALSVAESAKKTDQNFNQLTDQLAQALVAMKSATSP